MNATVKDDESRKPLPCQVKSNISFAQTLIVFFQKSINSIEKFKILEENNITKIGNWGDNFWQFFNMPQNVTKYLVRGKKEEKNWSKLGHPLKTVNFNWFLM